MSERKPTPAECEAWSQFDRSTHAKIIARDTWRVYPSNPFHRADAIKLGDYVLDLADRIRRERQEQEGRNE